MSLKKFFPHEELYKFCKEKIRKNCFNRIMKLNAEEGLQTEDSENVLNKLLCVILYLCLKKNRH